MYTLENLKQKNLSELKEIGQQLNVMPNGDRRCRQNWIDALVGTQPPLLQLLEASPGAEVEPVEDSPPLPDAIETPPGVESKFGRIVYPEPAVKPIAQTAINGTISDVEPRPASADFHHSLAQTAKPDGDSSSDEAASLGSQKGDRVLALAGDSQGSQGRALLDRPNELTAIFNDERPPNRGDGKGGRIEPKLSQSAIAPVAKNSPGVSRKTSTAHQLLELFKSSAHIIEESPAAETESEVLESAIVPAAKNLPRSESDLNPILTGITLSDSFLARYSPPQPENIYYQADPDGQLSLLNFEVESVNEPPDPDDFESIDAFRDAMARWDAENSEALAVSMESMCEWAPCPHEWYEPEAENLPLKASSMREPSEVLNCKPAIECSSTFSIPTFDAWCDRTNRQTDTDEPPDTGSFARLPGPKPPKFPPMSVVAGDRANRIKKFARSAALVSGRAPPGSDVM